MLYRIYVNIRGSLELAHHRDHGRLHATAPAGLAENSIRRVLGYQMINGMPFILVMLAFT